MKLLLSITLASVYGISLRFLFASFGDSMVIMSITFFFLVPFLVGYLTTFFETITQLEPGRHLDLNITTDPATISKAVMDEHIVIGGEHIRMQGDTYTLQPLPNGNTRLSLTSRFSINTPFNWYARIWANWLMTDVLTDELQFLKKSCTGLP